MDKLAGTQLITLDHAEVHTCEVLSALRHARHLTRANGQKLGGAFDGRDEDAHGMFGEYAVAKAINRFTPFVVDDPWSLEADVGRIYQVRTTQHRSGRLIVQEKDADDQVFILARLWTIREEGLQVRVGGWIWGRDAKRDEWWRTDVRSPAFFVQATALNDMAVLPAD